MTDFWKKAGPNLLVAGALILVIGLILITDGNGPAVASIGGVMMFAGLSIRAAARQQLPDTD